MSTHVQLYVYMYVCALCNKGRVLAYIGKILDTTCTCVRVCTWVHMGSQRGWPWTI